MKKLVLSTLTLMLMGVSSLQAEPPASERAALMAFYNATGGANWINKGSWGTGNVCDWNWNEDQTGVLCNDEKTHVIALYIDDNNLTGKIPKEIGNLTELMGLLLYKNNLTGTIPKEIGSLTKLVNLDLDTNNLTGEIPKEIGNLTELRYLYLYENNLTGEIPNTLNNLTKLYAMQLHHNAYLNTNDTALISFINEKEDYKTHDDKTNYQYILSTNDQTKTKEFQKQTLTDIYTKLGKADWIGDGYPCEDGWQGITCIDGVITKLNLSNKNLTGYIPKSIGSLSFLTRLDLEYNKLTGSIPKEIGNLTSLGSLSIHHNKLSGEIPKEILNLKNGETLWYFIAHSNCNLYSNNEEVIEYINSKNDMVGSSNTYDTITKTNTNDCNGLSPIYYLLLN